MNKKLILNKTGEQFINYCENKYNKFYLYLPIIYFKRNSKVNVICPIHGQFSILPIYHEKGSGCQKCARINAVKKRTKTQEEIMEKIISVHGDTYDLSELNYINIMTPLKITCYIHGVFYPHPQTFLKGSGCIKCRKSKPCFTQDLFLERAIKAHGNKWYYTNSKYETVDKKIEIGCYIHGSFWQTPRRHWKGEGCPNCGNYSKAEEKIENILLNHNIFFETQKKFKDCKNKLPLPFDFYISKYNLCIEYDGVQHFKPMRWSKDKQKMLENLEEVQHRDSIKTQYCKDNNISLIRIKYTEFDNLENIIKDIILYYGD